MNSIVQADKYHARLGSCSSLLSIISVCQDVSEFSQHQFPLAPLSNCVWKLRIERTSSLISSLAKMEGRSGEERKEWDDGRVKE